MAKLVQVGVYHDLCDAVVAQSVLDSHGIVAILPEWHHCTIAWHHLHAIGGYRLLTVDEAEADALDLLKTPQPELVSEKPASQEKLMFPCITFADLAIAAGALLLTGLAFPVWKRRRTG